jgi:hypothetical protein
MGFPEVCVSLSHLLPASGWLKLGRTYMKQARTRARVYAPF